MKRLVNILMIFAALLFVANVDAQVIRLTGNTIYDSYTGVAGDTAKSTTEKTFDIYVGKDYLYYYEVQASVDSAGDGTNFTVRIKGSNDESNWYNVGSAITYGVTSTDTVMRFHNIPDAETWSIAAATDYHDIDYQAANIYHNYDTSAGGYSVINDTVTVAAKTATDTVTVSARAYTITKDFPVGWRYLRLSFTGAGAAAKCELELLTVAIKRSLNY